MSVKWASLTSILAAIISALVAFLVFRFGIEFTGREVVGCWALIQGAMIIVRLPDSGLATNITRLVAIRRSEDRTPSLLRTFAAGFLVGNLPVVVIGALLIFPIQSYIDAKFSASISTKDSWDLLIAAYASGVLTSISGVLLGILEGLGRLVPRNIVSIIASIVMGITAYPLISIHGPAGLALTGLVLGAVQIVLCLCYLLFRLKHSHQSSPSTTSIAQELWRGSVDLTIVGVIRLTFEPATKLFLSIFASLDTLASFDLALRVTTNMRALIQAAIQPLFIVGSRASGNLSNNAAHLYRQSNAAIYQFSLIAAACQLAAAPIISEIGFGFADLNFFGFFFILVVANGINSIGAVGYYLKLSTPNIRPLLRLQFEMLLINLIGGFAGGAALGAPMIVASYGLAFAYGGAVSLYFWLSHEHVKILSFLIENTSKSAAICFASSAALYLIFWQMIIYGQPKHAAVLSIVGTTVAGGVVLKFAHGIRQSWLMVR
ncbi:hypothetical protein [uncultured Bradyrhizobium sp.]|jgi:O-antigen/teichoic acid export membrane protein|uniref:hypothetical protein n=1 Tax=uncultured Bradyrhizobium sp. TaxID=199684 RepID=UPI0026029C1B|nr:hypothetical protein [uncultured Bradyrhizobium sp.]